MRQFTDIGECFDAALAKLTDTACAKFKGEVTPDVRRRVRDALLSSEDGVAALVAATMAESYAQPAASRQTVAGAVRHPFSGD